jgi:hypothetical protein
LIFDVTRGVDRAVPPPVGSKPVPARSRKLPIEMRVAMIEVKIGLMIILIGSLLLSVYLTAQPRQGIAARLRSDSAACDADYPPGEGRCTLASQAAVDVRCIHAFRHAAIWFFTGPSQRM